jgi:hypothetical protein
MLWSREAYQGICANLCYGPVHDVPFVLFVLLRICKLQIPLDAAGFESHSLRQLRSDNLK